MNSNLTGTGSSVWRCGSHARRAQHDAGRALPRQRLGVELNPPPLMIGSHGTPRMLKEVVRQVKWYRTSRQEPSALDTDMREPGAFDRASRPDCGAASDTPSALPTAFVSCDHWAHSAISAAHAASALGSRRNPTRAPAGTRWRSAAADARRLPCRQARALAPLGLSVASSARAAAQRSHLIASRRSSRRTGLVSSRSGGSCPSES